MTAEFFCVSCDGPIVGAVTGSRCVNCLMGYEAEDYLCALCEGEKEPDSDTEYCDSCQEMLDGGAGLYDESAEGEEEDVF